MHGTCVALATVDENFMTFGRNNRNDSESLWILLKRFNLFYFHKREWPSQFENRKEQSVKPSEIDILSPSILVNVNSGCDQKARHLYIYLPLLCWYFSSLYHLTRLYFHQNFPYLIAKGSKYCRGYYIQCN